MKICPKCGAGNSDNAILCAECMETINSVEKAKEGMIDEFFAREERRERITNVIKWIMLPLYFIICIPFAYKCVQNAPGFLLYAFLLLIVPPVFYYFSMFKAEALFRFNHMFDLHIDNPEDLRPSEWYFMSSKIGAVTILLVGIFCVITSYISMTDNSLIVVDAGNVIGDTEKYIFETSGVTEEALISFGAVFINEDSREASIKKFDEFWLKYSNNEPIQFIFVINEAVYALDKTPEAVVLYKEINVDGVRVVNRYNVEIVRLSETVYSFADSGGVEIVKVEL